MMDKILVIAGPSGGGKTTIAEKLISMNSSLEMSRSHTTRAPRGDGRDYEYVYVDREEFLNKVSRGEMVEYTEYKGALYGTSISELERIISAGKLPIIVVDLVGIASFKQAVLSREVFVAYIYAPLSEIYNRLLNRASLSAHSAGAEDVLKVRIKANVEDYLSLPDNVKYIDGFFLNDNINTCARNIIKCLENGELYHEEDKNAIAESLAKMARDF